MLTLFGLFVTIAAEFGLCAWIIGAFCLLFYPLLAIYGLIACIVMSAPLWVYLVGVICIFIDLGTTL